MNLTEELIRQLKEAFPEAKVISTSELDNVAIAEVRHDDGCPAKASWNMDQCTCDRPEVEMHQDVGRHLALVQSRKQQRKAQSKARKAYRK